MESLEEPLDAAGNALADSSTEALRDRSKIYVFIGRSQTWNSERYTGQGFNDIDQIPAPTDSFDELSEIYDDMIAMKRVTRGDVNQVIRKRTWTVILVMTCISTTILLLISLQLVQINCMIHSFMS